MIKTKDLGVIPNSIVKSNLIDPKWNWSDMIEAAFYSTESVPDPTLTEHENPIVRYWLALHVRASIHP